MEARYEGLLGLIEQEILSNRLILPSLPEMALRVRELCSSEDVDIAHLEKVIAKDAAIAARLLKVANSSAMHCGIPLNSLKQAISRLGLNLVRSLVTQLAILQTMQGSGDDERLRGYVDSGLRISALCHSLSQSLPHLDREQAALAGLLHDIGKLPLLRFFKSHPELAPDENTRMGIEQALHPEVGAILLRHWNFPEELIQVAREHEAMERDAADLADYTDLVITANLLHHGVEQGAYAHLAGRVIPAMKKCLPSSPSPQDMQERMEQRMAMSLDLLDA
jgi:putative nucleotidyltransferase with HDIG domain